MPKPIPEEEHLDKSDQNRFQITVAADGSTVQLSLGRNPPKFEWLDIS